MKTDTNTFKAADLLRTLAEIMPSVSIEILWEYDNEVGPISKECDGFDGEDDDWQAWQSEVRATAICEGKTVMGSAYLGATFEKIEDHPSKSNPEISGYLPQMIIEALEDLQRSLPPRKSVDVIPAIESEISAALEVL